MTILTVKEAAEYLKVPVSIIYAHWRDLGGVKIGKHVRLSKEGIDEAIKNEIKNQKDILRQMETYTPWGSLEEPEEEPKFSKATIKIIKQNAHHYTRKLLRDLEEKNE